MSKPKKVTIIEDKVKQKKPKNMMLASAVIAGFMFLVLLCFMLYFNSEKNKANADAYNSAIRINELKDSISKQEKKNSKADEKLNQEVNGLDLVRKTTDDQLANTFFQNLTTWSNAKEYRAARRMMIEKYHVPAKSWLLTKFLPPLRQFNLRMGSNGYNRVDKDNLNLNFEDLSSNVISISGTDYRYFAKIEVSAHDKKGNIARTNLLAQYTVDGNGRIKDVTMSSIVDTVSNGDDNDDD